jgi:hypothetical protein
MSKSSEPVRLAREHKLDSFKLERGEQIELGA